MTRRDPRFTLLVAATAAAILGLGAALVHDVGRPYPGFFFAPDYRIFPVSAAATGAGLAYGDRIVRVNGQGPTDADGAGAGVPGPRGLRGRSGRPPVHRDAGAGAARVAGRGQPLRRLLWRVRGDAGGGPVRLRPEPGRPAEPALPRLHVPLGRVERGGAGGRARSGEVRVVDPRPAARPPGRPRVGVLLDVPGEPGPRSLARAPPRDPAALPRRLRARAAAHPGVRGSAPRRARPAGLGRALRGGGGVPVGPLVDLLPHQGGGAHRHAAARRLAPRQSADHRPAAGHRAGARRLDRLHAAAAAPPVGWGSSTPSWARPSS